MLTHAGERDCFWWNRTAYQLRAPYYRALGVAVPQAQKTAGHPNRKPCCEGDGNIATRWMGGAKDNFRQIVCPNDRCEFAQKIEGEQKPPCTPSMEFLFLLCWPFEKDLPSMLCRFDSHSWRTTQNFVGFFNHITTTAAKLGLENYSLFGYPFEIRLGEETQPSEKKKFPVSYITPTMDPMEFFAMQRTRHRLLAEPVATPILIEAEIEEEPTVLPEVGPQVLPATVKIAEMGAEAKPSTEPVQPAEQDTPKNESAQRIDPRQIAAERIKQLWTQRKFSKLSAIGKRFTLDISRVLRTQQIDIAESKLEALITALDE